MSAFSDSQNILRPEDSARLRRPTETGSDSESLEQAGLVVRELHRTVSAVCLYPETNPVCQSAIDRFTAALTEYVQRHHKLTLLVNEHGFTINGSTLAGARDDESALPSRCFTCGIRELTFTAAITPDSINRLLSIIRRTLTDSATDADLVDALWSDQIDGFSYDAIEDLGVIELDDNLRQEYFSDSDTERDHTEDSGKYQRIFVCDEQADRIGFTADSSPILESTLKTLGGDEVEESERPAMPSAEEMISRVYTLTNEEGIEAQRQLATDENFENERELFSLTSDILEQDHDLPDYIDTLDVCLRTHGRLIESGELRSAALLVNVIRRSAEEHKDQRPTWSHKAVEALTAVASRERLHRVADVLNANESISGEDLTEYLTVFDWTAYAALTELLGRLEHKDHRLAMCEFLASADEEHIDLLASGIYDKRWYVVRNAVNILLEFNNARAHKHLEKALTHGDARIREIILNGCADHDQQFVCRALQLLLKDPEEAIRTRALELSLNQRGPKAHDLYKSIVTSDWLDKLPLAQQEQALVGFSLSGDRQVVATLAEWAGKWSMLESAAKKERRKQVIYALSRHPSIDAVKALKKLSKSWNADTKQMAKEALKNRMQEIPTGASAHNPHHSDTVDE